MDHLVAAAPAQDREDRVAAVAGDAADLRRPVAGQPPSQRPVRACDLDRVAPLELPLDRAHPGRQQRAAPRQRPGGPRVHQQPALRREAPQDPALPRRPGVGGRQEPGAAPAVAQPGQRVVRLSGRDRHGNPGAGGDARGRELGPHPTAAVARRRLAPHRLDLGRQRRHHRDVGCQRVAPRVGGVEAVDVAQQDQGVRANHAGHPRRQPVVVAEADFGGGHRVVLVDHRHAAEPEQGFQRGARVEVAAARLGVLGSQQQLRRHQTLRRKRLGPRLREPDLADRRRRLLVGQPQPVAVHL